MISSSINMMYDMFRDGSLQKQIPSINSQIPHSGNCEYCCQDLLQQVIFQANTTINFSGRKDGKKQYQK